MSRIGERLRSLALRIRRVLLAIGGFLIVVLLTIVFIAPSALSEWIITIPLWVRLLIVAVIYVFALFIVYQEFWLGESRLVKGLVVHSPSGVLTSLSVESVRERISEVVRAVPDVKSVDVKVVETRGKADVSLDVVVGNTQASLPEKQKEINRAVEQVHKQLGFQYLDRPTVEISFSNGTGAASSVPENTLPAPSPITGTDPLTDDDSPAPEEAHERRGFLGRRPLRPAETRLEKPEATDEEAGEVDIYKIIEETASKPSSAPVIGQPGATAPPVSQEEVDQIMPEPPTKDENDDERGTSG